MKKNKIMALIMVIIIFISVLAIIIVSKINYLDPSLDGMDNEKREFVAEYEEATKENIQPISNISEFELVRTCIQKFYIYYELVFDEESLDLSEEVNIENISNYKSQLYNFLSKQYIDKYGITTDNINSKLKKIDNTNVEIYYANYITNYEKVNIYFVKGLLRNSDNSQSNEFEITLYIDSENQTFEVDLDNVIGKDYSELIKGEKLNITIPDKIYNRNINKFDYPSITYEDFAKMTFNNIRNLLLYNVDMAYNMLYDKERFITVDELYKFIEDNRKSILLMTFKMSDNNYEGEDFVIDIYDKESNFIIKTYFKDFSTFKFDIENI